jgi:hypothetical protein
MRAERTAAARVIAEERIHAAADVDAAIAALDDAVGRWWRLGQAIAPYEDVTQCREIMVQRKESIQDAMFAAGGGALAREILDLRLPSVKQPLAAYESGLWIALRRAGKSP